MEYAMARNAIYFPSIYLERKDEWRVYTIIGVKCVGYVVPGLGYEYGRYTNLVTVNNLEFS